MRRGEARVEDARRRCYGVVGHVDQHVLDDRGRLALVPRPERALPVQPDNPRLGRAQPQRISDERDHQRREDEADEAGDARDDAAGRVDAVAHVADLEGPLPRSAERRQRIEARGAGVGAAERSYDSGQHC